MNNIKIVDPTGGEDPFTKGNKLYGEGIISHVDRLQNNNSNETIYSFDAISKIASAGMEEMKTVFQNELAGNSLHELKEKGIDLLGMANSMIIETNPKIIETPHETRVNIIKGQLYDSQLMSEVKNKQELADNLSKKIVTAMEEKMVELGLTTEPSKQNFRH